MILADRGLDISDDLGIYGARLEILAFTRGEYSKRLKNLYSCRASNTPPKNKYTILQSTLLISFLKHKHDSEYTNIDRILTVCAALVNLCPSVVPE